MRRLTSAATLSVALCWSLGFGSFFLSVPPLACIFQCLWDAPIAQLDRASDYGSEGCRFNSYWVRHSPAISYESSLIYRVYSQPLERVRKILPLVAAEVTMLLHRGQKAEISRRSEVSSASVLTFCHLFHATLFSALRISAFQLTLASVQPTIIRRFQVSALLLALSLADTCSNLTRPSA